MPCMHLWPGSHGMHSTLGPSPSGSYKPFKHTHLEPSSLITKSLFLQFRGGSAFPAQAHGSDRSSCEGICQYRSRVPVGVRGLTSDFLAGTSM